ncbi:MAG: hypothetical protein GY714_03555 [Desulfobacterales bacterium]|nr:hypothetical protein [Desulfobacterales bacterium]
MGKIHFKNGFEYWCERRNIFGKWHHYWYFRPENNLIEIYINGLKKDIEKLLSEPDKALEYYTKEIKRKSDVDTAKKEFEDAKEVYECSKTDPYFDDFRGNNPNKIGRKTEAAYNRYNETDQRLKKAIELNRIITETNNQK